jgi:hypothetical protein
MLHNKYNTFAIRIPDHAPVEECIPDTATPIADHGPQGCLPTTGHDSVSSVTSLRDVTLSFAQTSGLRQTVVQRDTCPMALCVSQMNGPSTVNQQPVTFLL